MARGLRVVGGTVGGRRLVAPKGARPTTDRVKESLFSSLGPDRVEDATVLDLYAGSGALGIEALSRGAARAVFVDRDRHAVAAVRTNLAATGFTEQARVAGMTATSFVRSPPAEVPFDLVFCDPPYDQPVDRTAAALEALAAPGWLRDGATVVVECAARARPALPAPWRVVSERASGDTLLIVATVSADPPGRSDWS